MGESTMKRILIVVGAIAGLLPASAWATSPATRARWRCERALNRAATEYDRCLKRFPGDPDAECTTKYQRNWPILVNKYGKYHRGNCEGERYVDKGNGSFYDRLTRLSWEIKTHDGSVHDIANGFTWSSGAPFGANGTAFAFVEGLNDLQAGCFAKTCGWRVPTLAELRTIQPIRGGTWKPLGANDCTDNWIDDTGVDAPVCDYWTSTSVEGDPSSAYTLSFRWGAVYRDVTPKMESVSVRAVSNSCLH